MIMNMGNLGEYDFEYDYGPPVLEYTGPTIYDSAPVTTPISTSSVNDGFWYTDEPVSTYEGANTPTPPTQVYISNDTPENMAKAATAAMVRDPKSNIVLPVGISDQLVNQAINAAAKYGGQWLAKTLNGKTVLYPQNGGVGTFDLGKNLPLIAGVALLFMISK